jgi:predicted nucleic acid-binding protein
VRIPDLNLLLYAVDRTAPSHRRALRWWNASLSGTETVGPAWIVMLGFVRLAAGSRVVRSPDETIGRAVRPHPSLVVSGDQREADVDDRGSAPHRPLGCRLG